MQRMTIIEDSVSRVKFVSEPMGDFSTFKHKVGRANKARGNNRSRHKGKGYEARKRDCWMKKCP